MRRKLDDKLRVRPLLVCGLIGAASHHASAQCPDDDVPPVVFIVDYGHGAGPYYPDFWDDWIGTPGQTFAFNVDGRQLFVDFSPGHTVLSGDASGGMEDSSGFASVVWSQTRVYALFEYGQRVEISYRVRGQMSANWIRSDRPGEYPLRVDSGAHPCPHVSAFPQNPSVQDQCEISGTDSVGPNGYPQYRTFFDRAYRRVDVDVNSPWAIDARAIVGSQPGGWPCGNYPATANAYATVDLEVDASVVSCTGNMPITRVSQTGGENDAQMYADCRVTEFLDGYNGTVPTWEQLRDACEQRYTIRNKGCDLAVMAMNPRL